MKTEINNGKLKLFFFQMDLFLYKRSDLSTEDPLEAFNGDEQDMTHHDFARRDAFVGYMTYITYIMNLTFIILILLVACPLFIFILAKAELRKSPTCWFVINVLVAVLLMALISLPIIIENSYSFKLGSFGCHFSYILSSFNNVHIQLSLLMLFIDRFICIVKPTRHPDIMTPKVVRIMIICSVIFELILTLTALYTLMVPTVFAGDGYSICTAVGSPSAYGIYKLITHTLPLGFNFVFGIITILGGFATCRRLKTSETHEASLCGQAIALILTLVLLDVGCTLPHLMYINLENHDEFIWLIFQGLATSFFFIVNFPMMFLTPEIRSAIVACCKREKNGEKAPLVKPN